MILTKQPAVERDLSYGRFFGSVLALMGDAVRRLCVFTGCSLFEVYDSGYFFRSTSAWVMSRSPIGNRFSEKQDIVFFSHPLYLVNNIVILSKKVRRFLNGALFDFNNWFFCTFSFPYNRVFLNSAPDSTDKSAGATSKTVWQPFTPLSCMR